MAAQRRYIGARDSGPWWRQVALRECYGMGLPRPESGERPLPRLEGNTKPFRNLLKQARKRQPHRYNGALIGLVEAMGSAGVAQNALAPKLSRRPATTTTAHRPPGGAGPGGGGTGLAAVADGLAVPSE